VTATHFMLVFEVTFEFISTMQDWLMSIPWRWLRFSPF
jgi:hypothetical protein